MSNASDTIEIVAERVAQQAVHVVSQNDSKRDR